ncbi:MAG: ABC transporter substrate-binding protein [Gammaproteobacteria bacterium]|nr:ABC transporter substrate-binding protein [Gammaproteobacteria bacterium]
MTDHHPPLPANLAWADGSDAPEKSLLNIGFMPLTDSASLIVAATQGFGQPYGLSLQLRRQSSWSALRDRLLTGELDAAQGLYGLTYGMHLGLTAQQTPMTVLMGLNQNGQSIHLSKALLEAGVTDGISLARHIRQSPHRLTLAHTFPGGTHAMWLHYWLATHGIHPMRDVDMQVVPPARMVEHMQAGRIDGFCAGEPWGAQAVSEGLGFTVTTSQAIWPNHPEKVLTCTQAFVDQYPNTARALIMAVLDASRFIDADAANRDSTAQLISGDAFLATPAATLLPRLQGDYSDGRGQQWVDQHPLRFFAEGEVNPPYLSDGLWFLTQFRRWGLLKQDPDYLAVAQQVQQLDIYREAAAALGIALPSSPLRESRLFDGSLWNGTEPATYADSFPIQARSPLTRPEQD